MKRSVVLGALSATILTLSAGVLLAQSTTQPPAAPGNTTGNTTGNDAPPPPGTTLQTPPTAPSATTGIDTPAPTGSVSRESEMTKRSNPGPAGRTPEQPQPNSPAVK